MKFFEDDWRLIVMGMKTQVRRLRNNNEMLVMRDDRKCVVDTSRSNWNYFEEIYKVGVTYPVEPDFQKHAIVYHPEKAKRGLGIVGPGDPRYLRVEDGTWNWRIEGYVLAQINILNIHPQDARNIKDSEAHAEGYSHVHAFIRAWLINHDKIPGRARSYDKRLKAPLPVWAIKFELI